MVFHAFRFVKIQIWKLESKKKVLRQKLGLPAFTLKFVFDTKILIFFALILMMLTVQYMNGLLQLASQMIEELISFWESAERIRAWYQNRSLSGGPSKKLILSSISWTYSIWNCIINTFEFRLSCNCHLHWLILKRFSKKSKSISKQDFVLNQFKILDDRYFFSWDYSCLSSD